MIGSGTGATALVERCAFFNNSVLNTSMGGGGMVVDGSTGAVAMSVVVRDSVFSDNWVTSSEIPHSSAGGGLLVVLADALVENTTFLRNRVDGVGGGMAALTDDSAPGQQITVRNSTFSANYASSEGGGLFSSNLTLQNSTFSGNGADNMMNSPTGVGGSIAYVTTLNYSNNIIANSQGGKDCAESFMWSGGATIVTNINNLVEDGTGSDGGVNFLTGDPRLTQLADNGGAVTAAGYALQTHALELDSPARDTGDPATCLPADQRRLARPQGSACDRGAHEVGALHLQATVTPASAAPYQGLVTYTLVLTNTGASLAASAWLSDTLPPGVTFEQWIVSPTHTTLVNDVINWGDDLPAGATRTWRFTARNTGALDQPGDYGDTLVNFAQAGSDAGYRAAEEAVLTVECGDPPMVQTRNMDGLCSLRQIIADAPADAIITFRTELDGQTIAFDYTPDPYFYWRTPAPPENLLEITKNLTIDASSLSAPMILDGNHWGRILHVSNNAQVTLNHLTLTHGEHRVVGYYPHPSYPDPPHGGALKVDAGAVVTLTQMNVISNTLYNYYLTSDAYGNPIEEFIRGSGGGVYNAGVLIVQDSVIAKNHTDHGGGIRNVWTGSLVVSNTIFSDNQADYLWGGGVWNNGVINVSDSTFSNNQSWDYGGGLAMSTEDSWPPPTGIVRNSTFMGNRGVVGGGITVFTGQLLVENSTFLSNTAVDGYGTGGSGGGIYSNGALTVTNSTFISNTTPGQGGGIESTSSGRRVLVNNTFSGNRAVNGGGIYNNGTLHAWNNIIAHSPTGGDCVGTFATNVNNLVEDGSCGAAFSGDPLLGEIAYTGLGSTAVLPLLPTSPAIDAGDNATCLAADQRGELRADLGCDIGAYELKYADSDTVIRPVTTTLTTFGPALAGILRDAGFTNPGAITVTRSTAWNPQGPESIGAWWEITPAVTSGFSLTLQLCYTPAELGALTEGNLRFWRYHENAWTQIGGAPALSTVNGYRCAALSGVDQLSIWTLATSEPTAVSISYFSAIQQPGLVGLWGAGVVLGMVAIIIWRRRKQ